MASVFYNSFKHRLLDGTIDLDTDDIKVMLVTSAYSPDIDTHTVVGDVTNEVSGTGYTAGGESLTSIDASQDNTNDRGVYDADDVSWTSSTITARGAVMYDDTVVSPSKPLICYFDFGSDKSSSSSTFKIQWDGSGIFVIT